MTRRRAFITGITGQDGSYLAELLLEKNYDVHGLVRRASTNNTSRLQHLYQGIHSKHPHLTLHYGDLADGNNLTQLVLDLAPHEIYNLGGQSHVRVSFEKPVFTVDTMAMGTLRLLEAARLLMRHQEVRFYQASSSEMFGKVKAVPQNEQTPFHPRSPYACAKVYAHHQTVNYREAYNMFCTSGILFNHESPRRGDAFVTRKITRAATRIREGLENKLYLGNLEARRDWGYAKDYVVAMWQMLQQPQPDDFVIATGETHSVQEFLDVTFEHLGLDWHDHVEVDPIYYRPTEVDLLVGDASKAKKTFGWAPDTSFADLVRIMVEADWELARAERAGRVAHP